MTYDVAIDGKPYRLELERVDGQWQCRLNGRDILLDAVITRQNVLSLLMDGKSYEIKREISSTGWEVLGMRRNCATRVPCAAGGLRSKAPMG
jgi:hypothetical protein